MPFPVKNKKAFFSKPSALKPGAGVTITDDGHVFGYLAEWDARLIGSGRKNTRPPRSRSNYAYANHANYETAEGEIIKVGVLAGKGGHHFGGGFETMRSAYENPDHKSASVVYGEDDHGVWFSGAMCSNMTDADVQSIISTGVSGHWERPKPGKPLELLGSCSVNIPGFAQAAPHRIVASAAMTEMGGLVLTPALDDGTATANQESNKQRGIPERFSFEGAGSRIAASAGALLPVSGTLCVLGTPTSDGRQVNNVQWDRLPLPMWSKTDQGGWGHDGALMAGRIDTITIEGSIVNFTGVVDAGLAGGFDAEPVSQLGVLGISMDGMPATGSEILYEYDDDGWPSNVVFDEYQICGATLTPDPAFRETIGVQVGDEPVEQPVTEPLPAVGEDAPVEDDTTVPADDTTTADSADTEESVAASAAPEVTTIKLPIRH